MAIDKRPTRVAAMFDAIAARYDLLNRLLSAGIDRRWRRRAIRSLQLTGRESVVDVCTGTADVALTAVEARPGAARVVGLDFSGEMLRLGSRKVRRRGQAGRILLARGDATRLPIRSGSADAATVAFGIRNVEDPERGLAEMHRALAPGGRLAILEFSIPSSALVRAVYLPYFRFVLPRIGRLVSGHGSAYTYLPASVGSFIPPETMLAMLAACGFRGARATPLTLGIVTLYTARK
jgi:demethylmenaquinone methyltransferase/2-methoxy-6-polyprenyl-1,4-benzoquinol methylase